jgi:hypothetical protein
MRGTSRSVSAVVIAGVLAVSIAGCGKASSPTIYPHDVAVQVDDETFAVLNASIDATGGLQAWRTWASDEPLDDHITVDSATGGSECLPTDSWGLAGDPLGDFAGESLHSVNAVDVADVLATVQETWADAGLTDVDEERSENGVVVVTARHKAPSPVITFSYDGTSKQQEVALEGNSVCQSYAYLEDQPLDG